MEAKQEKIHAAISEVLEEALEAMAFISIDECSAEEAGQLQQQSMKVDLLITEPVLFEMRLSVSTELLYQIAETMYTMDREELDEQLVKDLLAEMLNTVAGRFMTEILPEQTPFTLSLPEEATDQDGSAALKYFYMAEDLPLSIEINSADMDSLYAVLD